MFVNITGVDPESSCTDDLVKPRAFPGGIESGGIPKCSFLGDSGEIDSPGESDLAALPGCDSSASPEPIICVR